MSTPNIKITMKPAVKGSRMHQWNVDKDGRPYGAIWTFHKSPGYCWKYNARLLSGQWASFDTLAEAKAFFA